MKSRHLYIISFMLLLAFGLKVFVPVCKNCFFASDLSIAQQDENVPEKSMEKFAQDKIEAADIPTNFTMTSLICNSQPFTRLNSPSFLPAQFFSIPTPPPWCKS